VRQAAKGPNVRDASRSNPFLRSIVAGNCDFGDEANLIRKTEAEWGRIGKRLL
jgi:hypothetical protein